MRPPTLPRRSLQATTLLLCLSLATGSAPIAATSLQSIPVSVLEDKIRGGWAGQMIGVAYGAPTEFQYLGKLVPEENLPEWEPEMVAVALDQDDLYVDITLASVLDKQGLDATTADFGAALRQANYPLWHANLAARRALRRGVPGTVSGTPGHNAHAGDIDFQIESDFIGLMTPGLPQASNELCGRVGPVMNQGEGLYGGMFVSAMYATAFFESDPRHIVEAGLAALPPTSSYARLISDVLDWSQRHPTDWIRVWQLIEERWSRLDSCPEGALTPFNIDAKINGAYVALGLLYGDGDFGTTLRIATRAGQDSDCNPSTAGGILGVVLGFRSIPSQYTSGFDSIADRKFSHTDSTFRTIVSDTLRRAIAMVERHGGHLEDDVLTVATQSAVPAAPLGGDDHGAPGERVAIDDPRWAWQGDWQRKTTEKWGSLFSCQVSAAAGASTSVRFRGTGAILVGWYLPTGGLADIYLDGNRVATVDAYPDENDFKFHEAIWHAFGLDNEEHEVRLVVRGEPYVESSGSEICLSGLLTFH